MLGPAVTPGERPRSTTATWARGSTRGCSGLGRVGFVMVLACSRTCLCGRLLSMGTVSWVAAHVAPWRSPPVVPAGGPRQPGHRRGPPRQLRPQEQPGLWGTRHPLRLPGRPGPVRQAQGQARIRATDALRPGLAVATPGWTDLSAHAGRPPGVVHQCGGAALAPLPRSSDTSSRTRSDTSGCTPTRAVNRGRRPGRLRDHFDDAYTAGFGIHRAWPLPGSHGPRRQRPTGLVLCRAFLWQDARIRPARPDQPNCREDI